MNISLKQLNLGYHYTVTKDEQNTVQIFKESNVVFVNGFVDGVYYHNADEKLNVQLSYFETLVSTLK